MTTLELHKRAAQLASHFRKIERDLIETLDALDRRRGFVELGYSSMHVYCTMALGLSDAEAYSLVGIARKSREFPEMKALLVDEKMTLANATQIMRVIDEDNKEDLLAKAQVLSKRELERDIKQQFPEKSARESLRPTTGTQSDLRLTISHSLASKLRRLQDLYSQKGQRFITLAETLEQMADEHLERHDPVRKAERNFSREKSPTVKSGRVSLPAQIRHEVFLRDRGQCSHLYLNGKRCIERRFLQIHHRVPLSEGGRNEVDNLVLLCRNHHRHQHRQAVASRITEAVAPRLPVRQGVINHQE